MRTTAADAGRLFYAINMNKTPVTFDMSPRPEGELLELRANEPITLPLTLQPLEVVLLRER